MRKKHAILLNAITNNQVADSNYKMASEIKEQAAAIREQNKIAKEDLRTKDRVDISLVDYKKLQEELEATKKAADQYKSFIREILNKTNHNVELASKIINSEKHNCFITTEENPMNLRTRVYISFEVDRLKL